MQSNVHDWISKTWNQLIFSIVNQQLISGKKMSQQKIRVSLENIVRFEKEINKATCQQPSSTPVEVKTTRSRKIFKGHMVSVTVFMALASTSIWKLNNSHCNGTNFTNGKVRKPKDRGNHHNYLGFCGGHRRYVMWGMKHTKVVHTRVLKPDC